METPANPSGYISNPIELLRPDWEAFKLAWLPLFKILAAILGFCIIAALVAYVVLMLVPGSMMPLGFLMISLAVIAGIVVFNYFGWMMTKVLLEAVRGRRISFTEARPTSWQVSLKLLWTGLLTALIVIGGFLLLIIPGLIFIIWFSQASMIVVDEGLSGWAALKRSKELVKGRFWEVAASILLSSCAYVLVIVPILGQIAYFLLTLALIPVTYVRYDQLKKLKAQPDWQNVPVHSMNYVVIIAGLILLGISTSNETNNASMLEKYSRPY